MYRLVALLLALQAASTLAERKHFFSEDYVKECRRMHPLKDEEMQSIDLEAGTLPSSEEFKCFSRCWYEKAKFVDQEGVFNMEEFEKFAEDVEAPQKLTPAVKACSQKKMETCQDAHDFSLCVLRAFVTLRQ